jgi:hypothetical protein
MPFCGLSRGLENTMTTPNKEKNLNFRRLDRRTVSFHWESTDRSNNDVIIDNHYFRTIAVFAQILYAWYSHITYFHLASSPSALIIIRRILLMRFEN